MKRIKKELNIKKHFLIAAMLSLLTTIIMLIIIMVTIWGGVVHAEDIIIDGNIIKPSSTKKSDIAIFQKTNPDRPFSIYTIKRGETISEIAWVLGIPIQQLIALNPEIMKNGIRNIRPGMQLKYYLPKDMVKIVTSNTNNVIQEVKISSNAIVEEINKRISEKGKKVKKAINDNGSLTRTIIKIEGDKIIKNNNTNSKKIINLENDSKKLLFKMKLQLIIVIVLLIIIIGLFFLNIAKKERRISKNNKKIKKKTDNIRKTTSPVTFQGKANPAPRNKILNKAKLNSISKGELYKESDEIQIDFSLENLGNFSISLPRRNDGRTNALMVINGETAHYAKEKQAKSSIRKSLNDYLYDSHQHNKETEEKIFSLIKSEKIVRK